jgi:TonB-dependent starch-binding outer membrane protein SusC
VNTDWVDLVLGTGSGFQTNHTVDFGGGTDATTYGIGLGYTKDNGTIGGEDFTRYNLRGNLSSDLTRWLNISYNNYITIATQNTGTWESFRSAYRLKPLGRPNNDDGSLRFFPTQKETQITNPLFDPDNSTKETRYIQYLGDIALKLQPVDGLTVTTKFSPNVKYTRYGEYRGLYTKEVVGNPSLTRAQVNNHNYMAYTWDNILNYEFELSSAHKLNATLVYSQYLQREENNYVQTRGFATDSHLFYNLDAGATINQVASDFSKQTLESYTGRLNYSLMDRYLFTFTGRYDGSSILAKGNKWAFFPSAAFAWQLSEEPFMQSKNLLSDAKVRLSYGQTGNNGQGGGLAPLQSESLLASGYTTMESGAVQTAYVTGLANKDLTWERTTEVNLGFDFGILKNRIFGSVDLYNRKSKDIIFYRPVSLVSGFTGTYDNVGEATNKGIELSINTVNVESGSLTWTTNLNYAHNKNTIDKLYGGEDMIPFSVQGASLAHKVGSSVGSIYHYEFDGIWQLDEAAEYGQFPGQVKVKDLNDDGEITDEDRTVIGQVSPKWTGGITNTINYKNIDFSFFIYTSQGNMMLSNFHTNLSFPYDNQPSRLFNGYKVNYWTPENPTNNWYQPGNGGRYQEAIKYRDVSYTKVGYMTLGYSLPKSLIERARISNLRIYATVQNPFIFTKYDGWDPENAGRNSWGAAYMSRTYIAGLNLAF